MSFPYVPGLAKRPVELRNLKCYLAEVRVRAQAVITERRYAVVEKCVEERLLAGEMIVNKSNCIA